MHRRANNTDCSGPYEQCGGQGFNGTTCCTVGHECTEDAVNPSGILAARPFLCAPTPLMDSAVRYTILPFEFAFFAPTTKIYISLLSYLRCALKLQNLTSPGGVDSDGNPWLENHDDRCPDGFLVRTSPRTIRSASRTKMLQAQEDGNKTLSIFAMRKRAKR